MNFKLIFQGSLLGVGKETLPQSKNPLLGSDTTSLQHDEVLLHLSIVREATHGCDGLVSKVVVCSSVVLDKLAVLHVVTSAHPVDLLVDLSSMMVSLLTSSWYGELDPAGMPCTDTSYLPQTLVGLPGQLLCVPPACHTLESVTLGNSNDVDHLILGKDSAYGNLLLEVVPGKVDLISDRSSVELNLHDVGLLLPASENLHLGVHDHTDGGAVLLHLVEILLNLLLAKIISPLRARLGESLLLGLRPVLVEPPLAFLADVLSPDSLQGPHAARSLDVADDADSDHGRGFDDGDGFNHLLLVVLGAGTVHLAHNVGHASLVSHEAGQMDLLAGIVLGEGLGLAAVALGPLLGEESLGPMTGSFEFPVRHRATNHVSCRSESSNK